MKKGFLLLEAAPPQTGPCRVQVSSEKVFFPQMLVEVGDPQVLEGGAEVRLFFPVLPKQGIDEGQEGAALFLLFGFLVLMSAIRPLPLQG